VEPGKKPDGTPSLVAVFGSLALVLGIFFALVWMLRRASPGAGVLPAEVFEVLGRAPLANRQQAHLLRCGNKLLLVSTGAAGTEPLTEITDPSEVERLTNLCRESRPAAATTALGRMFGQKGKSND
jgi:flagellar biogenesis protein FliO